MYDVSELVVLSHELFPGTLTLYRSEIRILGLEVPV